MTASRLTIRAAIGVGALLGALVASAPAQSLELTLSPKTVTFPSGNPDTVPSLVASSVQVRIRGISGNDTWRLTVIANGDLSAGAATINISEVTWTATPSPPMNNGTLNRTVAQLVASGKGSLNPAAQITFRLANSWSYAAGIYAQTVTFTLSSP